jgi:lysophospholipase L1-like esterase
MRNIFLIGLFALMMFSQPTMAQKEKWVTSWIGSVQGPYPVGNPSAQPNLSVVFPTPALGANNQSFRLIVRPDIWGKQTRVRLSNALGTQPITFENVYVGLQLGSAEIVKGSNQPVSFGGKKSVTIAPGQSAWSDPVKLPFVQKLGDANLEGRNMAVSFYIPGSSGPMTWHAKALTTSYVTAPNAGSKASDEVEAAFPFSTASWFFLDAVDMSAPTSTKVIVGFGDSITDGTASTMNGDDRWPDVLSRRLHKAYGNKVVVLNAGIGGNQVAGPAEYSPTKPFPGGPSSSMRLERDVLSLSGVTTVIWLEGINDFSKNGNANTQAVIDGMADGVRRLNAAGINVIGATVTSAFGSSSAAHGFQEQDDKRKALNQFIKTSPIFLSYIDFDEVILDPATGQMKPEFVPDSTIGGAGDKLHPNRVGYQAMGNAINLKQVTSFK